MSAQDIIRFKAMRAQQQLLEEQQAAHRAERGEPDPTLTRWQRWQASVYRLSDRLL